MNENSLAVLEARAGFGKSMVAKEVVQVAEKLARPHLVVRTTEGSESSLGVWSSLCAHILSSMDPKPDLLDHLQSEFGMKELQWLNDLLPPSFRVSDEAVQEEAREDEEGGAHRRGPEHCKLKRQAAAVKPPLALLLRSLVVHALPFIFFVEDLQ